MKFQANVVFELKADSIAEAGQRLDRLLKLAQDHHDLEAKAVELQIPPADALTAPSVVLPPVTVPTRSPGPQAEPLPFD
jgi:hypothetical protein